MAHVIIRDGQIATKRESPIYNRAQAASLPYTLSSGMLKLQPPMEHWPQIETLRRIGEIPTHSLEETTNSKTDLAR